MIRNLSAAAATFGEGSGAALRHGRPSWPQFTKVLANNDKLVRAFMQDLAGVSASLVSRARRAPAGAGGRRRRGRHREDVRPRQPQGAGHRRREAHPGDEDHQLRAGQPRHRPRRRPGGDRQPGPRLQPGVRDHRLADRHPGTTLGRRRLPLRDRPAVRACRRPARTSPARSSSSCWSRSRTASRRSRSGKQAGQVDDAAGTGRPDPSTAAGPDDLANRTQLSYATDDSPTLSGLLGGGS